MASRGPMNLLAQRMVQHTKTSFNAFRPTMNLRSAAAAPLDAKAVFDKAAKNMTKDQLFMYSSIGLATALPLGLLTAPSILAVPCDLVLSVALPVHMYLGARHVMEDYVPKNIRPRALQAWSVTSVLVSLGLIKICLCGPGLSYSVKSMWYPVKAQQQNH